MRMVFVVWEEGCLQRGPAERPFTAPCHLLEPQITTLDAERSGTLFASGGADRLVKVWKYDEGEVVAEGTGHSGTINKVRIAPDSTILVSVGEEGAVFIWRMPAP